MFKSPIFAHRTAGSYSTLFTSFLANLAMTSSIFIEPSLTRSTGTTISTRITIRQTLFANLISTISEKSSPRTTTYTLNLSQRDLSSELSSLAFQATASIFTPQTPSNTVFAAQFRRSVLVFLVRTGKTFASIYTIQTRSITIFTNIASIFELLSFAY